MAARLQRLARRPGAKGQRLARPDHHRQGQTAPPIGQRPHQRPGIDLVAQRPVARHHGAGGNPQPCHQGGQGLAGALSQTNGDRSPNQGGAAAKIGFDVGVGGIGHEESRSGAASAVGLQVLRGLLVQVGAMYRNQGSGRDSPREVGIAPGTLAA